MKVFMPEGYSEGSSDYPRTGELPRHKKEHAKQALSREISPEDETVLKDLLEKIAGLKPAGFEKFNRRYDELRDNLAEELSRLGLDVMELEKLFPDYFAGEEHKEKGVAEEEERLREEEEAEMKKLDELAEEKEVEKELAHRGAPEGGVKGSVSGVASGRVVDTLDEILRKVRIQRSVGKHVGRHKKVMGKAA